MEKSKTILDLISFEILLLYILRLYITGRDMC